MSEEMNLQKVVEILNRYKMLLREKWRSDEESKDAQEAIAFLENEMKEKTCEKWISVKDRLPINTATKWVWNGYYVEQAYYFDGQWSSVNPPIAWQDYTIPEPSKEASE